MDTKKELVDVLQAIPWFQELSDEHFKKICEITHLVDVDQGTTLFNEGDRDENLYIILDHII